jgi:hypothetical protein
MAMDRIHHLRGSLSDCFPPMVAFNSFGGLIRAAGACIVSKEGFRVAHYQRPKAAFLLD